MVKTVSENKILSETRWLAALVIPFLVVAFVILFFIPAETESLFAWKIQPSMSAMMLAAAYAGGIVFFTGVLRLKQWHKVKVGFLPVLSFASLLGIATILHWDKFSHGHISFFAWAGLYFTTPFIVLTVWIRNRNQDTGKSEDHDIVIPAIARLIIGFIGAITLVISLFLFVKPETMIDLWPWILTPLTARVVGAMFSLPGLVGLGIAFDKRWGAARLILQSQGFSILLILVAALRALGDFDWANIGSWLFVGGLGFMLVSFIILLVVMDKQIDKQSKND